ncbi:MAG: cysteine hydrolase [Planctomycetia bacterium]|nr:cysteine hydrolase [Planctomycetia bacterium]
MVSETELKQKWKRSETETESKLNWKGKFGVMKVKETAFIFIEFQNEFCTPGGKLFEAVKGELERNQTIANAQRLLAGAREKGCLVIHCPFVLNEEWTASHACSGILSGILENQIFAPNSWGHEIIDAMKPMEGEAVLENKHTLSAFSHTKLDAILRENGIKNLIISGFLTNVCAQGTAFSAYDAGYQTRMALDACCALSQSIQEYVEMQFAPVLGGKSLTDELLADIA